MEWVSGNVFIRPNKLPRQGDVTHGHAHNFDHTTIVFTGAIHVMAKLPEGHTMERTVRAPGHLLIRAGVEHEITALEPATQNTGVSIPTARRRARWWRRTPAGRRAIAELGRGRNGLPGVPAPPTDHTRPARSGPFVGEQLYRPDRIPVWPVLRWLVLR